MLVGDRGARSVGAQADVDTGIQQLTHRLHARPEQQVAPGVVLRGGATVAPARRSRAGSATRRGSGWWRASGSRSRPRYSTIGLPKKSCPVTTCSRVSCTCADHRQGQLVGQRTHLTAGSLCRRSAAVPTPTPARPTRRCCGWRPPATSSRTSASCSSPVRPRGAARSSAAKAGGIELGHERKVVDDRACPSSQSPAATGCRCRRRPAAPRRCARGRWPAPRAMSSTSVVQPVRSAFDRADQGAQVHLARLVSGTGMRVRTRCIHSSSGRFSVRPRWKCSCEC